MATPWFQRLTVDLEKECRCSRDLARQSRLVGWRVGRGFARLLICGATAVAPSRELQRKGHGATNKHDRPTLSPSVQSRDATQMCR